MNPNFDNRPRIAAIIITFNRLADLQANVLAMRAQTRPLDAILVVDNSSTDGTGEWLETQTGLVVIHQENRGSASAMAAGLNRMVELGCDWGWCVDDDAIPQPDALEVLCRAMQARPDVRVFNSLGLARNDPANFAIGALRVRTSPENYLTGHFVAEPSQMGPFIDANGMIDTLGGQFWHGTCIHREAVQAVGVPHVWLFLRGDEVEYGLRLMRAGYHIYSVPASHVFHPALPSVSVSLFGKTKSFKTTSGQKWYYSLRNGVWIQRTYYSQYPVLPYIARRLGGALLVELFVSPGKTLRERLETGQLALRGVADGMRLPLSLDTARPAASVKGTT